MESQGSIQVDDHGDVAVVSLIGDHDIVTAASVRQVLAAQAASSNGVVVSLMETTFFDSGIVRVLFATDKALRERDGRLVLHVATASIVARVLAVSGLSQRIVCTASLDQAVLLAAICPTETG